MVSGPKYLGHRSMLPPNALKVTRPGTELSPARRMKNHGCFLSALAMIGSELLMWAVLAGGMIGCFWVFDRFDIRDTGQQVAIAISPFLVLAYFIWRRDNLKPRDPPK